MALAATHFFAAQAWCLVVVAAFFGWGALGLSCLGGVIRSAGLAGCVGVGLAATLGGVLDLFHLVTAPVLIGCVLAGAGLAVVQMIRASPASWMEVAALRAAWGPSWTWSRLLLLVLFVLLALRLSATTRVVEYAWADDKLFYLAEPVKMMDLHFLAAEPYSQRRVISSVGGNYFLQGLVLSVLPPGNIQMADQAIGLMALVLIVLALARVYELSAVETMVLAIFAVAIPPMDRNLTFVVLPSALFLALALLGGAPAEFKLGAWRQSVLLGFIAGTLCAIKSTFIPHAALFCGLFFLLQGWWNGWPRTWRGWVAAAGGAFVVLAPWLVVNRADTGTFLYPLLGRGDDFSTYRLLPLQQSTSVGHVLVDGALYFVPLAAMILAQVSIYRNDNRAAVLLATTSACLGGILALGLSNDAESIRRYNMPIVVPVFLTAFLLFSLERHRLPARKSRLVLQLASGAVLALAAAVVAVGPQGAEYAMLRDRVKVALADAPVDAPQTVRDYAAISAALPGDSGAIVTLQHAYLLKPFTTKMYLADWPGCASPAPGWPILGSGDDLAAFLLRHSVRYLAYSYKDDELLDVSRLEILPKGHNSVWGAAECRYYVLAQRQYLAMAQSHRKIYDDGSAFILDLQTRK